MAAPAPPTPGSTTAPRSARSPRRAGRSTSRRAWKTRRSARRDLGLLRRPRLAFKFLRGPRVVMMLNSKYAARGSSGKLVTIYPADDDELELVLKELDEILARRPRPLHPQRSALRRRPPFRAVRRLRRALLPGRGPRAGVLAIADADGHPGPRPARDRRSTPPSWAALPGFLEPHLAARNAVTTDRLPYRIEKVHALLQRRRRLPGAGHPHRRAGGAQGGPPARRPRRSRPGRGDPAAARGRHPPAARRAGRRPRAARLLRARRAPLPGPGVHRRDDR